MAYMAPHTDLASARVDMRAKQQWPYETKVRHAARLIGEFYDNVVGEQLGDKDKLVWNEDDSYSYPNGKPEKGVHISVAGLDSITLLCFIRSLGYWDVPAISVSSLEDGSIQRIHQAMGVEILAPYKNKVEVLNELGFPVLSKEKAGKIDLLQNPTEKNATVRHAIMTGETGKQGGYRKGTRMKMPQKWLELFGGPENERYGTNYKTAPFKVSSKCCYYLKEKPCDDWARTHNSYPILGLMASEGGQREKALAMHGCNYYGKTTVRSCPLAIFTRQDLLRLTLEMEQWCKDEGLLEEWGIDSIVPSIYGTIERDEQGNLFTTGAQRTGCSMCGFGIHIEGRPHRFDRLRERNPKEWEYWMYRCVTDAETGEVYGWGRVLDYIGVKWETPPEPQP